MVTSLNNFCLLPHLCRDSRNRRFVDVRVRPRSIGKGRKPSVDVERVKELRDSGMGASAIAKKLGIGRASVYRALGQGLLNTL